ncbi:hypothetical protein [Flavobacterium gilvum]|uniref:hypothetical protein n=1 Tax=Flavobacterium gilvum TaxID=1492737 RepID=UPI0012E02AAF|nr:hypothetical protein [Flavobacterium gilvum]
MSNIAKVKSVDENKATCILEDEDGQEFFDVRLRPVLSGKKSFVLVPKVGSYVLAIRIEDDDDWMVIASDEIEKVGFEIGITKMELTDKVHIEANGESLATLFDDLFAAIGNMVFVTPSGNTTSMVNIAEFTTLKTRFKQLLK